MGSSCSGEQCGRGWMEGKKSPEFPNIPFSEQLNVITHSPQDGKNTSEMVTCHFPFSPTPRKPDQSTLLRNN